MTPAMVLTMLANGACREAVLEAYPVLEPADSTHVCSLTERGDRR